MVDDTTDITTLQQYITFVQYINARGGQSTAFLDIRQIGTGGGGATAANLFRLWNEVASDYTLDVNKHVALACDGAAAMIGCRNSLSQKLTEQNQGHLEKTRPFALFVTSLLVGHCFSLRDKINPVDSVCEVSNLGHRKKL